MALQYDRQGRDHFYRILEPWPGMVMAYSTAARVEQKLARIPHPVARAQLVLLRGAMSTVRRQMRAVEANTAQHADQAIRNRIKATQRRPGGSGRLAEGVRSRPIQSVLPSGSVGIADIDRLDRRVVGGANSGRYPGTAGRQPYWHVQEEGSTHLVGRTMVGFFMPGYSRPNRMQFRQHSRFSTSTGGRGYGGAMTVRRPIEARHFLRDGANDAEKFRYRSSVAFTAQSVRKIEAIIAIGRR